MSTKRQLVVFAQPENESGKGGAILKYSTSYKGSFSNLIPEKLGLSDEQISVWLNIE